MPPPALAESTVPVAVPVVPVPGRAPASLTRRGVAAARLSEFQDAWAELGAEDRAWFAWWLSELLIDASTAEMALRSASVEAPRAAVPRAPAARSSPERP